MLKYELNTFRMRSALLGCRQWNVRIRLTRRRRNNRRGMTVAAQSLGIKSISKIYIYYKSNSVKSYTVRWMPCRPIIPTWLARWFDSRDKWRNFKSVLSIVRVGVNIVLLERSRSVGVEEERTESAEINLSPMSSQYNAIQSHIDTFAILLFLEGYRCAAAETGRK